MRQPKVSGTLSFRHALRRPRRLLALTVLGLALVGLFASAATPGLATHFIISGAPANSTAGQPLNFTVTAYDSAGPDQIDTGYMGTVHFTSTDEGDQTVVPGDYTFTGADNGVHLFAAETTLTTAGPQTVTVSDGSITDGTSAITVDPAAASQFALDPSDSTPTAGTAFDVAFAALDPFGNTDTNYDGAKTIDYTGPGSSPGPVVTPPDYPASATSVNFTDGSGTATAIKLFDANSTETLTATEQSTTVSGSAALDVGPEAASQFALTTTSTTVMAGQARNLTITAMDPYGNTATGYTGDKGLMFSGANNSPNGTQPTVTNKTGTAVVFGTAEIITFSSGVATVTGSNNGVMKLYKAESPNITVSAGSLTTTTALAMTVNPAVAATPPTFFNVQPTLTQKAATINDTTGVRVTVEDQYGNPRSGDTVSMAIGSNPGGGTLTCSPVNCQASTNASGVATFSGLKISASGLGYTLVAKTPPPPSPTSTTTSATFDIVDQLATVGTGGCTGTSCTVNDNTPKTDTTVTAFNLGTGVFSSRLGPAMSALVQSSARLGVTVDAAVPIPAGVCGGGAILGDGFQISSTQLSVAQPYYKIVATLNKNIVQQKAGKNPSPNSFDICLGAKNTNYAGANPDPNCNNPATSGSWPTKNGTCAVFNAATGLYWGLVGDLPGANKNTPCPPSGFFPGIIARNKTNAGDVVITLCKPYPWDGAGGFH